MPKKDFEALSAREKMKYLFHKYIWEGIFIVYLAALLGSWIYVDYVADQPVLNVEMINGARDGTGVAAFQNFMNEQGYPCSEKSVHLGNQIQTNEIPVNPSSLIISKAQTGKTDVYFWNEYQIGYTLAKQDLLDLRDVLPPEVIQKCQDRLIYNKPLLRGGYPCAIRLENDSWAEENGFYKGCVVGISRNARDPDLAAAFVEYII